MTSFESVDTESDDGAASKPRRIEAGRTPVWWLTASRRTSSENPGMP